MNKIQILNMEKLRFLVWCGLLSLATFVMHRVNADELGVTNTIRWGVPQEGLQLGVEPEEQSGVVSCYIRNATTNVVEYNDYYLGHGELASVEILQGEFWLRLSKRQADQIFYSAGPSPRYNRSVKPKTFIKDLTWNHPIPPQKTELATNNLIETNNSLFKVHLLTFKWPLEVSKEKSIKMKVSVGLCTSVPGSDWQRRRNYTLESPVIEINSIQLEKLTTRLPLTQDK